jgi:hypothetical protein
MINNPMISTFSYLGYQPNDWGRLPIRLRQRWWEETDYGSQQPSEELKQLIKEALEPKP